MIKHLVIISILTFSIQSFLNAQTLRVMNFQGDNGYQHNSKDEAKALIKMLGDKNQWEISDIDNTNRELFKNLEVFDVLVFNNNCGTDGPIFSEEEQKALKQYMASGGGFVGIHCAGAVWKEDGSFQDWYEELIGTRLVAHPSVQQATLIIENNSHSCTEHLPHEWQIKDEWHYFSNNPRGKVNVLISLDEKSYEAEPEFKMGGDHPFTWYQYIHGGRSFFTSLGHTEAIYENADFQQLLEKGILWAAGQSRTEKDLNAYGLILDLDADKEVAITKEDRVYKWTNQIKGSLAQDFVINDYGLRIENPGSGMPLLKTGLSEINGHNAISFREDELINMQEDAFDYLITGSGYTWFTIIKPYQTQDPDGKTEFGTDRLKDVNSFFGNLKNGDKYEGLWGCLDDDLGLWCGSRNGVTFGRFDENNPKLSGPHLKADNYYIIAARMGSGTGTVDIEVFANSPKAYASVKYPVNIHANPSKLAIGTERNATNHPGSESFDGEIARFLIYERPLSNSELEEVMQYLSNQYLIGLD